MEIDLCTAQKLKEKRDTKQRNVEVQITPDYLWDPSRNLRRHIAKEELKDGYAY